VVFDPKLEECLFPLLFEFLVELLLTAPLLALYLLVFVLKPFAATAISHDLLRDRPLSLLIAKPRGEIVGVSFYNGPNLGIFWKSRVVLLVVAVGVKDATHLDQLQVALKFRGQVGTRHIKPLRSSSFLLVLNLEWYDVSALWYDITLC